MTMTNDDPIIMPVYAALNADGTIELEVVISGVDDFVTLTIPATRETKRIAGDGTREILLDADHDPENGALRKLVQAFITHAEHQQKEAMQRAAPVKRR
jgi:hypothetical protein